MNSNEKMSVLNDLSWETGERRMFEATGYEDSRRGKSVLGLLDYYQAVLQREGLAARLGEIKSIKLGLTLDLLKMVNIPEDLKSCLVTSVLRSWEMNGKGNPGEGEEEMKTMHRCIDAVLEKAQMMHHNGSPVDLLQLDITIMLALPLMPHDLKKDEVPGIRNMLNEVMEEFTARREQGFAPCL